MMMMMLLLKHGFQSVLQNHHLNKIRMMMDFKMMKHVDCNDKMMIQNEVDSLGISLSYK